LREALVAAERNADPLKAFQIARLKLFASAMMVAVERRELLTITDLNLLYQYRRDLETLPQERRIIFRSVIADDADVSPGWFWLNFATQEDLLVALTVIAVRDGNIATRRHALTTLTVLNMMPSADIKKDFFAAITNDEEDAVRVAAFSYLGTVGGTDELELLEIAITDPVIAVRTAATYAKYRILVKHTPELALAMAISGEKNAKVSDLAPHASRLSEDALEQALAKGSPDSRRFAAEELRRRGRLSRDTATLLLKDSAARVRKIAIETLIDDGEAVTREQIHKLFESSKSPSLLGGFGDDYVSSLDILARRLERQSAAELEHQMLWLTGEGPHAYRILALNHFDRFGERIRRDLSDRGETLLRESLEAARQTFGEEGEQLFERIRDEHTEFIRGEYIGAGLAGIAANGRAEDVALARPHVNSKESYIQNEALRVLERFGNASDLDTLMSIAQGGLGDANLLAAKAALRIAPGIDGASRAFLASGSVHLVVLALQAMKDIPPADVLPLILPLLENEDATIRIKVLSFFVDREEEESLRSLLDDYLKSSYYYYNVVAWLDRVLYAPTPLRLTYRRQLIEEEGYRTAK
jgi:HEAT repeat protein